MADGGTFAGPMQSDSADYSPSDVGSSFGSGLSFGNAQAGPEPTAPAAQPEAPTVIGAPSNDLPAQPQPSFGQGLRNMLPGPHYTAPDPQATALDQTADTLTQRIARANQVATNPVLQFFNPEGVKAARDFVPAATEQLQKIRQQQAGMAANRQQAATLGLNPGEVPDEASMADRVEVAKAKALQGNLSVFKGLQLVDPKTAETIQDQVSEVAGKHLSNAQLAFDSLSGMQNEGQYQAKLSQLRKDGTLTDLEALGLKTPTSFDAFNAGKGSEGKALRDARMAVENIRNKLEARNTAQPMEKAEAETYPAGTWATTGGDGIRGQPSRIAATGARGLIVDGYDDPRKLGRGAVLATPEQRKSIKEDAELAVPKEDLEKFRGNNRTYKLATTDSNGKEIPAEGMLNSKGERIFLNTNPNVQQGIAEGLASALRGGQGGANVGLLKIETSKRGYIQGLLDSLTTNYSGAINTVSGEQLKPYLTKLTQKEQRDVLDFLHQYNAGDIPDRLATTAKRAGALGLDAAALGFGTKEAAGPVNDAIEEGRQAQIALDMQRHQAIGGGRGFLSYGALNPAAGAPQGPPGSTPTTQLPGPGNQTPVQQAQNPQLTPPKAPPGGGAPPAVSQPGTAVPPPGTSGPAGGGSPPASITIAGQQVTAPMPPGASPNYVQAVQRIETPNEKNPWTAGTPKSSASGAFQFINSTWAASKPPGAPARAADATPAQQAQALATLTAQNAQVLQNAKLPVNDTTLYMAHNVGSGGAMALLRSDPNADARSIVGKEAADNNPKFFRGKPTVATVMDRYNQAMSEAPDEGPKPKPGAGGATAEQPPTFMQRVSRTFMQGVPQAQRDQAAADVGNAAVEHAPAIGSTVGAIGGSAAGPAGTVAGGAAGGGAGQSLKDWMQGRDQNPVAIAKEAALGGVLGIASPARPLVAGAARVAGSAAVEGGAAAIEGGDTADVIDAAAKGGGLALGGEALGRFISAAGPAAHKLFSKFTPDAQAELSAQAGKLVEARKVLASEQPKLAGEGAGANPKFEAAKKAEEDASQFIKDHGQKPDDMAYAYEQTKAGTSAGEAAVLRKANTERADTVAGYDKLRQDVRETGVGAPKPNQPMADGPVAQIRTAENPTGKVPEAFRADAEHAEMLVKAPAKDWGTKWQQLQDAGSELIKKRMAFLANNDKPSAEAMNNIFQGVRNQQKAAAEYVFGKEQGAKVISHLEDLDKRYAKVMNATQGMDYQKMYSVIQGGNTPASRELEANFKEFAKDDPMAIRAFNAMKAGAKGRLGEEAKLMAPIILGEVSGFIPTAGMLTAAVGGHRLVELMKQYMNAKLLGKPVAFKDFASDAMKAYAATHGTLNAAGSAVQRGMVQ